MTTNQTPSQHKPISAGIDQFAERVIAELNRQVKERKYDDPLALGLSAATEIVSAEASKQADIGDAVGPEPDYSNAPDGSDVYCALLWMYRRLRNSYGRLTFIEQAIAQALADSQQPQPAEPIAQPVESKSILKRKAIQREEDPIAQPAQDSRADFEAYLRSIKFTAPLFFERFTAHSPAALTDPYLNDNYVSETVRNRWAGWQAARAQGDAVDAWISVKDRLPKGGMPVLVACGKHVLRAAHAGKFELAEDNWGSFNGGDGGDYNETEDTYYWPEGWYEWNQYEECHWQVETEPTHWQPLPAIAADKERA